MIKKIMIFAMIFLLVFGIYVNAEKPIPSSLDKPASFTVRDDGGPLLIRWTILQA